tara:strand:- start:153 stop:365 length:213 start_codon:yes stop_codon:yes gene_type:complete
MDVSKAFNTTGHGADLGLRLSGVGGDEVRAAVVGEIAGEITDGLEAFATAEVQLDKKLDWAATAGLKWRW